MVGKCPGEKKSWLDFVVLEKGQDFDISKRLWDIVLVGFGHVGKLSWWDLVMLGNCLGGIKS